MAEAMALRDGRFLAVGSTADTDRYRGDETTVIDLEGRFVMPGFIDAHIRPIRSRLMENVGISLCASVPMTPE